MQSFVCPYFGILAENPFPRERLCMLGWLCIVQSLWAYTPGVRAGLNVGLPPSPRLGLRPKPHFQKLYRFIDSLRQRRPALPLMFINLLQLRLFAWSKACSFQSL